MASKHGLVGNIHFFPGRVQFWLQPPLKGSILSLHPGDSAVDPFVGTDKVQSVMRRVQVGPRSLSEKCVFLWCLKQNRSIMSYEQELPTVPPGSGVSASPQ